jgi:hypothetical protein
MTCASCGSRRPRPGQRLPDPLRRRGGYGIESLRDDLRRFTFLLCESDGEGIFPATRLRLREPAGNGRLGVSCTLRTRRKPARNLHLTTADAASSA